MNATSMLGVFAGTFAGLFIGSSAWPMIFIKKFQYEHWWFSGMLTGLIAIP